MQSAFKQWGVYAEGTPNSSKIVLPIAVTSGVYAVVVTDMASSGYPLSYGVYNISKNAYYIFARRISNNIESVIFGQWIAIGK